MPKVGYYKYEKNQMEYKVQQMVSSKGRFYTLAKYFPESIRTLVQERYYTGYAGHKSKSHHEFDSLHDLNKHIKEAIDYALEYTYSEEPVIMLNFKVQGLTGKSIIGALDNKTMNIISESWPKDYHGFYLEVTFAVKVSSPGNEDKYLECMLMRETNTMFNKDRYSKLCFDDLYYWIQTKTVRPSSYILPLNKQNYEFAANFTKNISNMARAIATYLGPDHSHLEDKIKSSQLLIG